MREKKQVLFIHGADSCSNYEDFLTSLRTRPIDSYQEPSKRWKHTLAEQLGSDFEVIMPQMPNSENAKYLEWKIWFERYFEFLGGEVVLIGHSQGGYFLAKYLTENTVPFTLAALYLVAAPIAPDDFSGEDGGDFNFDPTGLNHLEEQARQVIIVHSEDDEIVPFAHALRYKKALPKAVFMSFPDRGHFLQPEFPELISHIQSLS